MATKLYVVIVHEDGCDPYAALGSLTEANAQQEAKGRIETLCAENRREGVDCDVSQLATKRWVLSNDAGVIAYAEVQETWLD